MRGKEFNGLLDQRARIGRMAAQSPLAQARRKESKRRHDLARSKWSPADQAAWLTDEEYTNRIQPGLRTATLSEIAPAIAVLIPYASDIRKARRRPHPRHWDALTKLVGLRADVIKRAATEYMFSIALS
jgi:hypothetical protein